MSIILQKEIDQSQSLSQDLLYKHNFSQLDINVRQMRDFVVDAVTDLNGVTKSLLKDHLDRVQQAVDDLPNQIEALDTLHSNTELALKNLIILIMVVPSSENQESLDKVREVLKDYLISK